MRKPGHYEPQDFGVREIDGKWYSVNLLNGSKRRHLTETRARWAVEKLQRQAVYAGELYERHGEL